MTSPENMDQLYSKLSKDFGTHLLQSFIDDKDPRSGNLVFLIGLAILAYAGVEIVNLVFRRNFGSKGINVFRMVLSVLLLFFLAYWSYSYYAEYLPEYGYIGSRSSFLATSIFYVVLAVYVIYKGVGSFGSTESTLHPSYRGDSSLLGFLIKGGWTPAKIQNLAEPLLLFALGFFLMPLNLYWGIPLMFCAISSWAHLGAEVVLDMLNQRNSLSNKGHAYNHNQSFTRVVN